MRVVASAPGKLMLYGEHAVVYGSPCIVTAVDQRVRVSVEPNGEGEIHVSSPNVGLDEYHKKITRLGQDDLPKSMAFVEMLVKRFYEKNKIIQGIRISTESDFSTQFGFGSSAAVVSALVLALSKFFEVAMSKKEMFEMAYQAVLDVQGVGSGFDVASSIYGGTLYYVTPGAVIEPVYESELPLVVGYTGIKADTPTIIRQVAELKRKEQWVDSVFRDIKDLVNKAKKEFMQKNFAQLGLLMDNNQKLLSTLRVSSKELDNLIRAVREVGAYGAKLSGAGGGDCMVAFCPEEKLDDAGSAIERAGGIWMKVKTGAEGVKFDNE